MTRARCRESLSPTPRRSIRQDDPFTRALAYVIVSAFAICCVTFFVVTSVALFRWVV